VLSAQLRAIARQPPPFYPCAMNRETNDHVGSILLGSGLGSLAALKREIHEGRLTPIFWVALASLLLGIVLLAAMSLGRQTDGG